jgi:hypothetical protein
LEKIFEIASLKKSAAPARRRDGSVVLPYAARSESPHKISAKKLGAALQPFAVLRHFGVNFLRNQT